MALITVPLLMFSMPCFNNASIPLIALATSMAIVSVRSICSVLVAPIDVRMGNIIEAQLLKRIFAALLLFFALEILLGA